MGRVPVSAIHSLELAPNPCTTNRRSCRQSVATIANETCARTRATHSFSEQRLVNPLVNKKVVAISEDQISVGKVLGEGNFGKVFAGEYYYEHGKKVSGRDGWIAPLRVHVGAQVPVALKAIKATNDPRSKDDMKKEAFVMKELSHPCIVRLYGICQSRKLGSTLMVLTCCAR